MHMVFALSFCSIKLSTWKYVLQKKFFFCENLFCYLIWMMRKIFQRNEGRTERSSNWAILDEQLRFHSRAWEKERWTFFNEKTNDWNDFRVKMNPRIQKLILLKSLFGLYKDLSYTGKFIISFWIPRVVRNLRSQTNGQSTPFEFTFNIVLEFSKLLLNVDASVNIPTFLCSLVRSTSDLGV